MSMLIHNLSFIGKPEMCLPTSRKSRGLLRHILALTLRGAFFCFGGAAPAVAGAGC